MTQDADRATTTRAHRPAVRWIGAPRVLAGLDGADRVDLARHRHLHGEPTRRSRADLEAAAAEVGLLGRGGAAFPVAVKLRALPPSGTSAVVVNGSESEPASWKDRVLMRRAPHLLLDGALGVANAVGAREVVVVVHDHEAAWSLRRAVVERDDTAMVSVVHNAVPSFVAGEARAVLRAAEGDVAVPTGRRVLPSDRGYQGRPTFLSNAETFAQLALLMLRGVGGFAGTGVSDEPGTTLLTVSGGGLAPSVVEVPHGVPLPLLLDSLGAPPDGRVLLGGYHGTWLHQRDVLLSRRQCAERGVTLGAGVVGLVGGDTCPLGEVARVAGWLAGESAGQCGPCFFGLPAVAADLGRVWAGQQRGLDALQRRLGLLPGRGACAHPDGVARMLRTALEVFPDEVRTHLTHGGCGRQVLGHLPLPGDPPAVRAEAA